MYTLNSWQRISGLVSEKMNCLVTSWLRHSDSCNSDFRPRPEKCVSATSESNYYSAIFVALLAIALCIAEKEKCIWAAKFRISPAELVRGWGTIAICAICPTNDKFPKNGWQWKTIHRTEINNSYNSDHSNTNNSDHSNTSSNVLNRDHNYKFHTQHNHNHLHHQNITQHFLAPTQQCLKSTQGYSLHK